MYLNCLKYFFYLSIFILVNFCAFAQNNFPCTKTLKIGWEQWEPFHMKINGKLVGMEIELMNAIVEETGCKVEFVEIPWARALISLQQGELDLLMAASKNADREEKYKFTNTYVTNSYVLFVRKGESIKYPFVHFKELMNRKIKIGILRGNVYGKEIDPFIKDPANKNIFYINSLDSLNYQMINANRVDAAIADLYSGTHVIKSLGLNNKLETHPNVISEPDPCHYMFNKSTPDAIIQAFDKALNKFKVNGKLKEIQSKYLLIP